MDVRLRPSYVRLQGQTFFNSIFLEVKFFLKKKKGNKEQEK